MAMADKPGSSVDAIYDGLAYGGIGFGALAALAPRVFTGMYGLKGGGDGNLRIMVRLWGTSIGALGAIAMMTTDKAARRKLATAITAMNLADAMLTLNAGSDVAARGRVLGGATSAAFGAAGAYWLTQTT
jgi:hypothetical protein